MGAGHDGAALELQRRLEAQGHSVEVVDYLEMIPFHLGGFVRWTYRFQLQKLAWTYDLTYRALNRGGAILWAPVVRAMSMLTRRAVERHLRRTRPDVIVSTYPLASLVLGRMRKKRWLRVPVATYLTDFAVHSLWVHPGIDLHMAVSPSSAEAADRRGSPVSVASGPLVGDRFRGDAPDRDDMRRRLGIKPGQRAVLVVAGSWGVGDVGTTVAAITRCDDDYHPIVVCGKDERLRASLLESGLDGTVLGWTDDMPGLMAAADVLVENAGGLSAMEAFAAGLPVVSYQPIAGHGKDNAKFMAGSGVSRYAHEESELGEVLHVATEPGEERDRLLAAGRSLFAGNPADDVLGLAAHTRADALLVPFQTPRGRRCVALAAISLVGVYAALTTGAHGVAALGVGTAKRPVQAGDSVYLGVRVSQHDLGDERLLSAIESMHATLVVDGQTAAAHVPELAAVGRRDIEIANGGWGKGRTLRWNRAHDDCDRASKAIKLATGQAPHDFVPGRALDAFDAIYCKTGKAHQALVRIDKAFRPKTESGLEDRKIYLADGRHRSPERLEATLDEFESRADTAGFAIHPIGDLH